jgi:DNA-binding transcriptional MerR regulator
MIGQIPDFPENQGFPDSKIDSAPTSPLDQPDIQPFESGIQFRGGSSGHYDKEREAEALTDIRNTMRDYLIAAFSKEELRRILYASDPDMRAIRDQIAKSSGIEGAADATIAYALAKGIDLTTRVIDATARENPIRYQQYKQQLDDGLNKARQVIPEVAEPETPPPTEDEQHQLKKIIRQFLDAGFTDDDLRRLLRYSRDPQVAALERETTTDVGKSDNLDRIVELARTQNILPNLAAEAAQKNPRMYARFERAIRAELAKLGEQLSHVEETQIPQQ